jgi:hypothetical protein
MDLKDAIVTDFTEREWKYLDKKQRKMVERNTPTHVLRTWRGERFESAVSFSWSTWVFVIAPLVFFAFCILILGASFVVDHLPATILPKTS